MVSRRGFLQGLLAVAAAPAIVRAESLMKIAVPKKEILVLDDFVTGVGNGDLTTEMFTNTGEGWHHYAVTSKNGVVELYVDGVKAVKEELLKGWVKIEVNRNELLKTNELRLLEPNMRRTRMDDFRITKGVARTPDMMLPAQQAKVAHPGLIHVPDSCLVSDVALFESKARSSIGVACYH